MRASANVEMNPNNVGLSQWQCEAQGSTRQSPFERVNEDLMRKQAHQGMTRHRVEHLKVKQTYQGINNSGASFFTGPPFSSWSWACPPLGVLQRCCWQQQYRLQANCCSQLHCPLQPQQLRCPLQLQQLLQRSMGMPALQVCGGRPSRFHIPSLHSQRSLTSSRRC